jgi:flagellar motility protein MotE (MotC chaperone)
MKRLFFAMTQTHCNNKQKMRKMRKTTKNFLLVASLLLLAQIAQAADAKTPKSYGSVEERRIENTILQERADIRKEREDVSLRKKELKTLEEGVDKKLADMDRKLAELKLLQNKIEQLLADKSAKEVKRIKNLATIYAKMSPPKAALVLSGLDKQLAADLLAEMKVKAAAKILDQISKQKATELSTTFSTIQLE